MSELDFLVTIKTNLADYKEQTFIAKPGVPLKIRDDIASKLRTISIIVNSNPPQGSSVNDKQPYTPNS